MAAVLEAVPANMHMSIQQARPATAAPPARAVTKRSQHPLPRGRSTRHARRASRAAPQATAPAAHLLLPEPN